eukprot:TRINITY_DN9785_c1_g1_i1.p2 TRINITY_DN9785_c1_g1~~TRINITY_DN9785_c1_g1_i1.p2  ORF type:complete len:162 (-),score=28.94 TRINITY_DN9785_c1_g1_i1:113-598(-)
MESLHTVKKNEGDELSHAEVEMCQKAFNQHDRDKSGTIDIQELKALLNQMNLYPTDEEMFVLMNSVDDDGSGEIDFTEFLNLVQVQKTMAKKVNDDSDTIEAFVALGGNRDLSGKVLIQKLQDVINEFELTVSLPELVKDVDKDQSGEITYEEFFSMLAKV